MATEDMVDVVLGGLDSFYASRVFI